jgi:hypothetical protein
MNQLDNLLNVAIQDALRNNIANIYRDTVRNINIRRRYFNDPPTGGYTLNEELEYILPDRDDISSTILLDIVTRFGSPGNDSIHDHIKTHRKNQIKNIQYKKIKELGDLPPECPICLEEFKCGEYYRKLECSHCFHKKCIDRWFKKDHSECPMCRKKIING